MADLADINVSIEVDDTSVLKGIDRVARLEKGYGKLDKAFNKGKITAQQYSKGIQQVDTAIKRATASTKAFEQTQMAATKASNRMGVVTQQAGYQVSDFIVQVQSGTNVFVAFGQQASQLVGVLPLVARQLGITTAAAIGLSASLGIIIPLVTAFGAAWLRSKEATEKTGKSIDVLQEAMNKLKKETKAARDEISLLATGVATLTEKIILDNIIKLESQIIQTINKIDNIQKQLNKETNAALQGILKLQIQGAEQQLDALGDQIAEQEDLLKGYKDALDFKERELAFYNDIAGTAEGLKAAEDALLQMEEQKVAAIENQNKLRNESLAAADKGRLMAEQELAIMAGISGELTTIIHKRTQLTKGRGAGGGRGSIIPNDIDIALMGMGGETIIYPEKKNKALQKEIELTRELTDVQKQQVAIADSVSSSFGDMFMTMVDGTTSAKDAFRSMATDIIQQLYRILVVEQLVNSIAGAITGGFAPASAAGTKGTVAPPRRPTGVFGKYEGGGYTGSGPRSGGLDGKGGFMAMLHPRETIVDHTKGQGAGGTVVNQVFNISANTSDDTKRLITQTIAQASPSIINQSVGAVMNQRRRGGSMKSAFG